MRRTQLTISLIEPLVFLDVVFSPDIHRTLDSLLLLTFLAVFVALASLFLPSVIISRTKWFRRLTA